MYAGHFSTSPQLQHRTANASPLSTSKMAHAHPSHTTFYQELARIITRSPQKWGSINGLLGTPLSPVLSHPPNLSGPVQNSSYQSGCPKGSPPRSLLCFKAFGESSETLG